MPDVLVEGFHKGLDQRRLEVASEAGSLSKAFDIEITNGGEIRNRKSFVSTYTMTGAAAGTTFGLGEQDGNVYVFGGIATPAGVPAGVTYQRLQHPGAATMTEILDIEQFNGKLYVIAKYSDASVYHFYDGSRITDWFDGKARGSFSITGGTNSAGVNEITSTKVNGVEIQDTDVDWATSHATTATNLAAQIVSYASTPEYSAVANGAEVVVIAGTAGTASNGLSLTVAVAGDVTASTPVALSGGLDGSSGDPGASCVPLKDKMYVTAGKNVHFSALRDATHFNSTYTGAGFMTPATHSSGAATITGLAVFVDNLAIIAANAIQVWFVDADDENNELQQVLVGSGTTAVRSVLPLPNGDLYFMAHDGIKALRVRESLQTGAVVNVGAAIDVAVVEQIAAVSTTVRDQACAVREPREGRFMLSVGNRVFVHSYFPEKNVNAWSIFRPGFTITDWVTVGNKLYARSGDVIYLYGGSAFTTYYSGECVARIPYLDAAKPGGYKDLKSIDAALQGTWTIKQSTSLANPTTLETLSVQTGSTYDAPLTPVAGRTTHVAIELIHQADEEGRVSSSVLHYDRDEDS